jgi:ribose transport system permease protein
VSTRADRLSVSSAGLESSESSVPRRRLFDPRRLLKRRFGGLWVLAVMVAFFGIATPHTFLTWLTFKLILSNSAVTGLLALAVMLPLLTGSFDLSVAYVAGFTMILGASLNVANHLGAVEICVITLLAAVGFGLISATLVTKFNVSSFVATLGVGTMALGITEQIGGGNAIEPSFGHAFSELGGGTLFGQIPLPFVYVVALAFALHYLLEHTALGRRLQAVGGNREAARLAGIRVRRLQAAVLLMSALIAGFTGLVLATQVGVATNTTAPPLLFEAIAALFLGATQLKQGPNPWGTVLGVVILGTGTEGLQLLGASPAISDLFSGLVLILAVSVSGRGGMEQIQ